MSEELKQVRTPTGVMAWSVSYYQDSIRVDFSSSPHFNTQKSKQIGDAIGEMIAEKLIELAERNKNVTEERID
jgi:hypothetical protein